MMKKIFSIIIPLYLVISILIYIFVDSYVLRDVVFMVPVIASVFFSILLLRHTGYHKGFGWTILLFAFGFTAWAIAESIFIFYMDVLEVEAFPSIADFFYLSAYPFFLLGVVNELANYGFSIKKTFTWLRGLVLLLGVLLVVGVQISLILDTSATMIEVLVNSLYGFGDLIILVLVFLLVDVIFRLKGAKFSLPWIMFMVGMLITLVADLLFALFYQQYEEGVMIFLLIDVVFITSYLFFVFSICLFCNMLHGMQQKIKEKV